MLRLFKSNTPLLALMFFEVLLLPMWNVGPIPLKVSFLIIIYSLLKSIPKNSFIPFFLSLIVLLWLGKIFSFLFLNETDFTQTIRITLNYLLIISAISYSVKINKIDNLNWIALLAILFFTINIVILIFGPSIPSIISFYKLDLRLEEGLFLVRNPGIMGNPNGSALVGNLIFLFWIVAKKFNLITFKSNLWTWIVIISIGLANLSFVSRSGFLAFLILITYLLFQNFKFKKILSLFFSFLIIGFLSVFTLNKIDPEKLQILSYGLETVINLDDQISDEINRNRGQGGDANRLDKIVFGIENFYVSPLFGVGSDRSTGQILNRTQYHNDWIETLVSTGSIGFIIYLLVTLKIFRISRILIIPILIPGLTNSFIFTLQIVAFYFLFVGIISRRKLEIN